MVVIGRRRRQTFRVLVVVVVVMVVVVVVVVVVGVGHAEWCPVGIQPSSLFVLLLLCGKQ